jgi:hypothetical protein
VKIIKAGNLPSHYVTFTCQKCGCQFEAAKELETKLVYDQREGDFWQCSCPTCGRQCTKGIA